MKNISHYFKRAFLRKRVTIIESENIIIVSDDITTKEYYYDDYNGNVMVHLECKNCKHRDVQTDKYFDNFQQFKNGVFALNGITKHDDIVYQNGKCSACHC